MKKRIYIFILSVLLIVCGGKETYANATYPKEITYEEFETEKFKNFTGDIIDYDEDGKVILKTSSKNGKLNGEWAEYLDVGTVKGIYKDGKMNGEWTWYGKEGNILARRMYKDDKWNGEWVSYSNFGNILSKGIYKDGKQDGEWIGYYENGNIEYIGTYIDGKADGEFTEYNEDGTIKSKTLLKDGEEIK